MLAAAWVVTVTSSSFARAFDTLLHGLEEGIVEPLDNGRDTPRTLRPHGTGCQQRSETHAKQNSTVCLHGLGSSSIVRILQSPLDR